ncbi:MAG: DUF2846 domain-containing protein [Betaproteobacteria bacterium]
MNRTIGLFAVIVELSGCATSGATYKETLGNTPALQAGMGRIYFYRPSQFGAAIRPDVVLDGEVVGKAIWHGFFYVDRLPGTHEVVVSTEIVDKTPVRLAAGETCYVRLEGGFGIIMGRTYARQVNATTGESEMLSLHYTGD